MRFKRFRHEWYRSVVGANTTVKQLLRVLGFVAFLATPDLAHLSEPNLHLLLPRGISLDGWKVLQVAVVIAIALIAGGAAWIKSEGPIINSDGVLDDDQSSPGGRAIRFRNRGAVAAKDVSFVLTRISRNGEPLHETSLPLELTTIETIYPRSPCYIKCFSPWRGNNNLRGFSLGIADTIAVKQDGGNPVHFMVVAYCDSREVTKQWYRAIPVVDDRIFDLQTCCDP